MPMGPPEAGPMVMPVGQNSSLFNFILVLSLGYLLKINQRLAHIQSEKLKTEVSYLKAQINPHFLFNTLNSVYALTLEKSDSAPEAVLKLSYMMRYVVTESSRDYVSLEKEIEYIKNYISLQQLRMDENASFSFIITGSPLGKNISPLLLIPFIENAFKYGINPEEKSVITINIDITSHEIVLNVENNKVRMELSPEDKSEQGIENTRQRLEYLYPGKHKLLIFDNPHTFAVNLSITLV
jgi:LytS/YehU family sensor histidine kinase